MLRLRPASRCSLKHLSPTICTRAYNFDRKPVLKKIANNVDISSFKALDKLPTTTTDYFTQHSTKQNPVFYETASYINNKLFKSKASEWFPVNDPATNEVVTEVPQSTEEELDMAIESAYQTFHNGWKQTTPIKRQQILANYVEKVKNNWDRLASTIVIEQGKSFSDARNDVLRGLQCAEHAMAGVHIDNALLGSSLEVSTNMYTTMYREPLGVISSICPFNFPAMITLWTIPYIIATGNTNVIKPSERCPGTTLLLAELAAEAGVPPGVINIVHGKHDTVNKLVHDSRIAAVTFVGGDRAGEYIYKEASALGKRCQANRGAKNHSVVVPDADKEHFLNSITAGAFGGAGQRCVSTDIIFTVGKETEEWIPEIVEKAKQFKALPGFMDGDLGPVVTPESKRRIIEIIDDAEAKGATILLDGRNYTPPVSSELIDTYSKGNFVGPTIIDNAKPGMRCVDEEMFGPVLAIMRGYTLDDCIEYISRNKYGNATALFTQSGALAEKFTKNVDIGQIGINVPVPVPLPMFGFTGTKASFLGDLNYYGKTAFYFLTKPKTTTALWRTSTPKAEKPNVNMD
ncbi:LAFE_0D11936g1_1 [Lachancea fermentati]|uniref:methylmalonate-semialdehyde dehydrogenase (CoA acylating) n=1 Tax=Lachancea fermentati TaxID=4955 RepID=A0A1G4MCA6_LACFM|nr:LAFE_0D11936g1_1 [Lachancea fermentati]